MSYIGGFFDAIHLSQLAYSAPTRRSGCTWTAGTNGARAATGGKFALTPDQVHALVDRTEETNPETPGWSIPDLDRAMARAKVPFENRTGQGRDGLRAAWNASLVTVIQGDSDQFSNATCSGVFDGDHAITAGPATRLVAGQRQRWIHDSICPTGRWEYESIIFRYAEKLNAGIRFGVFTTPVPKQVGWWPDWMPTPPSTATFSITVPAGTTFNLRDEYNRFVRVETTTKGFTAYGNGRRKVASGGVIGHLITGSYRDLYINTAWGSVRNKP